MFEPTFTACFIVSAHIALNQSLCSIVKNIDIRAGGLGFDSRAGQIKHSVTNGMPPLRCFFGAVLPKH